MSDDIHQPPEMITNVKLSATQTTILKAAANRPDGNLEPLPPTLRGGARAKVIEGLLARGLAADADGHILLTDAGYTAVGKRRPVVKGIQKMDAPDALTRSEPIPRTIRSGTKLATIIDAMRHPGGATIAQMMASTDWQAHSIRGAISGMVRKRLGYEVVTVKGADGRAPIALPDREPPKGLRAPQALFFGQISRWPICHFSALKSPETMPALAEVGVTVFRFQGGEFNAHPGPVQTANPANLGLHPDAHNWIAHRRAFLRQDTVCQPPSHSNGKQEVQPMPKTIPPRHRSACPPTRSAGWNTRSTPGLPNAPRHRGR